MVAVSLKKKKKKKKTNTKKKINKQENKKCFLSLLDSGKFYFLCGCLHDDVPPSLHNAAAADFLADLVANQHQRHAHKRTEQTDCGGITEVDVAAAVEGLVIDVSL